MITEFGMSTSNSQAQSDFLIKGLNLFKNMDLKGCWLVYRNSAFVNYGNRGQVGFWLNGIFLLIIFSTLNLVLQTTLNLSFTYTALIDVVVMAIPFGCIARFINRGWKKPID